jgi:hypothetical protein
MPILQKLLQKFDEERKKFNALFIRLAYPL